MKFLKPMLLSMLWNSKSGEIKITSIQWSIKIPLGICWGLNKLYNIRRKRLHNRLKRLMYLDYRQRSKDYSLSCLMQILTMSKELRTIEYRCRNWWSSWQSWSRKAHKMRLSKNNPMWTKDHRSKASKRKSVNICKSLRKRAQKLRNCCKIYKGLMTRIGLWG